MSIAFVFVLLSLAAWMPNATDGIQVGGNTTVSPPPFNATASAPRTTSRSNFSTSQGFPVRAEGWRLVDNNSSSSNPIAGRLEVRINGFWGTVCDDVFTDASARVACFSLGFGRIGYFVYNTYGPGTGPIHLDQVSCIGYESDIGACRHNPVGVHDCSHSEDVSISCATDGIQVGGNTTVSPPPLNATAYTSRTTSRSNFSTSQGSFAPTLKYNFTTVPTNAPKTSRIYFSTSQGSLALTFNPNSTTVPTNGTFRLRPTTRINGLGKTTKRAANATTTTSSWNVAFNGSTPTMSSNTSARVNALYNATTSRANGGFWLRPTTRINGLGKRTKRAVLSGNTTTSAHSNVTTVRANATTTTASWNVAFNGSTPTMSSNASARVNAQYNATKSRANGGFWLRPTTRINGLGKTTKRAANIKTGRPRTI